MMKSCIFVTIRQYQVPVVQKVDCAIHQINLYPLGRAVGFPNNYPLDSDLSGAGCKENHFKAFLFGKLKLAFTSLNIISTTPKNFLTSRIDFTVLLLFEFLKKHHLPIGQVKNRIH